MVAGSPRPRRAHFRRTYPTAALYLQTHFADGAYLERIATDYVDYLVLLVPAHYTWILSSVKRQVRFFNRAPSHHSLLQICNGQFDLAIIGHGRKTFPNLGLAALLLRECLRACDVGKFAIAIFTRNTGWVLRIKKPVKMAKSAGCLVAGL